MAALVVSASVPEPVPFVAAVIDRVQQYRGEPYEPPAEGAEPEERKPLAVNAGDIYALVDEIFRLRGLLEQERGQVRKDERARLAALLLSSRAVLESAFPEGLSLDLVAFLITLDHG